VLGHAESALCAFGLSKAKARYARLLAEAVEDGTLDLGELDRLDDNAARAALMRVKGIGRWTADIYLMFALGRPDVWPVGDVALAAAAERLLELPARPDHARMEKLAEGWRPWRTAAAVMLWHFYRHPDPGRS